jgi:hypothetical protein
MSLSSLSLSPVVLHGSRGRTKDSDLWIGSIIPHADEDLLIGYEDCKINQKLSINPED